MADITISDLELAPALADDMVFPVENLTDTYAATLAMLRRLLNKTFVEEENADFNDLTNDGFYQCTGTPTNSPVAGSIVWTLEVSTQGGVTVQRAFSLDDDFANLYIRRWNGVSWTAWIEEGAGALAGKANIDLDNLSATGKSLASTLSCLSGGTLVSNSFTSGTQFTATSNGWFKFQATSNNITYRMLLVNDSVMGAPSVGGDFYTNGALLSLMMRVKKGDMVSFYYSHCNLSSGGNGAWFYPDEGEV